MTLLFAAGNAGAHGALNLQRAKPSACVEWLIILWTGVLTLHGGA
jgi:hypothetical protein